MSQSLYEIRDYTPADRNFLRATFLRGNYYGHSWFNLIPQDIYFKNYAKVADHLIDSGTMVIKIACLPDDPSVILGYSILSPDYQTIHWCHVKDRFRKNGIAKALLPKHPTQVSHLNDLGKSLLLKFPTAIFNPFAL